MYSELCHCHDGSSVLSVIKRAVSYADVLGSVGTGSAAVVGRMLSRIPALIKSSTSSGVTISGAVVSMLLPTGSGQGSKPLEYFAEK